MAHRPLPHPQPARHAASILVRPPLPSRLVKRFAEPDEAVTDPAADAVTSANAADPKPDYIKTPEGGWAGQGYAGTVEQGALPYLNKVAEDFVKPFAGSGGDDGDGVEGGDDGAGRVAAKYLAEYTSSMWGKGLLPPPDLYPRPLSYTRSVNHTPCRSCRLTPPPCLLTTPGGASSQRSKCRRRYERAYDGKARARIMGIAAICPR